QTTDVGGGRGAKYLDIVGGYLRHLKRRAEAAAGTTIEHAVLGRPVFFVDDDPVRDAQAQAALEAAARQVGFTDVQFQYEPIAAATGSRRAPKRRRSRSPTAGRPRSICRTPSAGSRRPWPSPKRSRRSRPTSSASSRRRARPRPTQGSRRIGSTRSTSPAAR